MSAGKAVIRSRGLGAMFHEVSVITEGRRHSLVAFFLGQSREVAARKGRTVASSAPQEQES